MREAFWFAVFMVAILVLSGILVISVGVAIAGLAGVLSLWAVALGVVGVFLSTYVGSLVLEWTVDRADA